MKYEIEGSIVNTENATHQIEADRRPAQYGHVDRTLYRSRRGRWYVASVYNYSMDGRSIDYAEWVSPEQAVRFIEMAGGVSTAFPGLAAAADNVIE